MTPRIAGTTQRERKEDTVVEAKATTPVPLHVEKFGSFKLIPTKKTPHFSSSEYH